MEKCNNVGRADLHVHTTYSDGMLSPGEVVRGAAGSGLRAVAITDHDCVDGVGPGIDAGSKVGLEVIPGIEISAAKDEIEIHILGYFIDWQEPSLLKKLSRMRENRVERMNRMVCLLRGRGADLSEEDVIGTSPDGTVGRLHLARVMVEKNIVTGAREAFDRYIGDGKPCHVKHERLDYREAIDMIRRAGGVPVLAHPGTMGKDKYIPDYIDAGLRGIETFHTNHAAAASTRYLSLAGEHDLVTTGGSDCHGTEINNILIGNVSVGYEAVRALYKEAENIRRNNLSS